MKRVTANARWDKDALMGLTMNALQAYAQDFKQRMPQHSEQVRLPEIAASSTTESCETTHRDCRTQEQQKLRPPSKNEENHMETMLQTRQSAIQ